MILKKRSILTWLIGISIVSSPVIINATDNSGDPSQVTEKSVSSPQFEDSLTYRIRQLERALSPQTPQAAAQTWVQGLQTRNGALQFAILSPQLRQVFGSNSVNEYWVTGFSSPWIESYRIVSQTQHGDRSLFKIEYQLMTSSGSAGTETQNIQVEHFETDNERTQGWYITEFSPSPYSLTLEAQ